MKKVLPLISVILFKILGSFAQDATNANFELITESDGLNSRAITCMIQDNRGFLWIGTEDGLARYDGYVFKDYRNHPRDKKSITPGGISSIALDKDGIIWVGHYNGILNKLNPISEEFSPVLTDDPSTTQTIKTLFVDRQNNVWAFIQGKGLFTYNRTKNKLEFRNALPHDTLAFTRGKNTIFDIREDTNGLFWIATRYGLLTYNPIQNEFGEVEVSGSNLPSKNKIEFYNIIEDQAGNYWLSSFGSGVVCYNLKTKKFSEHLYDKRTAGFSNVVWRITKKNENELWVSTGSGLGIFTLKDRTFTFFSTQPESNPGEQCFSTLQDRNGILWVSNERGLSKLSPFSNRFKFNTQKVTRSTNGKFYGVTSVYNDTTSNTLLVGTFLADGLHVINKLTQKESIHDFKVNGDEKELLSVHDILRDRQDTFWILTQDLIYQYDISSRKLVEQQQPENVPTSPDYSRIFQTSDGNIWIGTHDLGLFKYDIKNKKYINYRFSPDKNSICSNFIVDLDEDQKHRLWIASAQDGISIFDPEKNFFQNFKHSENDSSSLPDNKITSLTKTPDGDIWISTFNGLAQCRQGDIKTLINWSADKLPVNMVYGVESDLDGNIWAMTGKGLICFQPRSNTIRTYDIADGLKGDYNHLKLRDDGSGNLYLATYRGYYLFSPRKLLNDKLETPPLWITSFKVHEKDYLNKLRANTDYVVPLHHNENSLSIEFAALNFLHRSKNYYSYKLEGLDDDWSVSHTDRHVNYASLPPGKYTFRVRLMNSESQRTPELFFHLEVSPPIWSTNWFLGTSLLTFFSMIFIVTRYHTNNIKKEERLKTEYHSKIAELEINSLRSQLNSHFIFNSLNALNRFIIKNESEKASLFLTKLAKLIRLILQNSKNRTVTLEQELAAAKLYIEMESIRLNNKFNYQLEVDPKIQLNTALIPPMVIQPYIENAIWHGLLHKESVGNLLVKVVKNQNSLSIIIEDDGIGRARSEALRSEATSEGKAYGMKMTSERLYITSDGNTFRPSILVDDLYDKDGVPSGTRVTIKIFLNDTNDLKT